MCSPPPTSPSSNPPHIPQPNLTYRTQNRHHVGSRQHRALAGSCETAPACTWCKVGITKMHTAVHRKEESGTGIGSEVRRVPACTGFSSRVCCMGLDCRPCFSQTGVKACRGRASRPCGILFYAGWQVYSTLMSCGYLGAVQGNLGGLGTGSRAVIDPRARCFICVSLKHPLSALSMKRV